MQSSLPEDLTKDYLVGFHDRMEQARKLLTDKTRSRLKRGLLVLNDKIETHGAAV